MFTINSSEFPVTSSVGYGAGVTVNDSVGISGAQFSRFQQFENPSLEEVGTVLAPVVIDGALTASLPLSSGGHEIETVSAVSIGRRYYTLGTTSNKTPGTFSFDESNQLLTIHPYSTIESISIGETIKYNAITKNKIVYSDGFNGVIPQLFRDKNVFEMSFSRSLEQSPSGSFKVLQSISSFDPCDFVEGTTFLWNAKSYGIASVSAIFRPVNTDGLIEVEIALKGPHDHLLDRQIRYRGGLLGAGIPLGLSGQESNSSGDPGTITSLSSSSTEAKSQINIPFSTFCNRGGVSFIGPDPIIKIDQDSDVRRSSTIASEMARNRSVQSFSYLSNPDGLEFRDWFTGTRIHHVSESELLNGADGDNPNPYTINYNVEGHEWNNVKLAVEYLNTQLNLDNAEGSGQQENNRVNTTVTIRTGNGLPKGGGGGEVFKPPEDASKRVATNAFDLGGPTREIIIQTYQNGKLISKTIERKGYLYSTADYSSVIPKKFEWIDASTGQIVEVPGGGSTVGLVNLPTIAGTSFNLTASGSGPFALDRWEIVENESEIYEHDSDGYEIKITRTLKTHRRHKQETDALETTVLEAQKRLLQFWGAGLGTTGFEFSFSDRRISALPTDDLGNYQELLDQINGDLALYEYFETTETDTTEHELASLENLYPNMPQLAEGEPERKYIKSTTRSHKAKYETFDAGINVPEGLIIESGEEREDTEENQIVYPTASTSEATYNEAKDLYTRTTTYKRSSGPGLQNVFKEPPLYEEIRGKLPQAPRLELFEDGADPSSDEPVENVKTLILNTPNNGLSPESDAIDGSVSFPSADTKAKGLVAAVTDISIQNTQAIEVWNGLLLAHIRDYSVGDRVVYKGSSYRILSVTETPSIQGGVVKQEPYQVSWARDIDLRGHIALSEID